MKAKLVGVLMATLATSCAASATTYTGFTGPVAPANWSVDNVGTLTGVAPVLGSAAFSSSQLVLVGANAVSSGAGASACAGGLFQVLGPCQVQTTIKLPGSYSFDWSYLTSDAAGPSADIFGVILDSARIPLSDPGGTNAQSGTATFAATSYFGFFINCTDCIRGSARAVISNLVFNTVSVPSPVAGAGLPALASLLGFVWWRRRRGTPQTI